MYWFYVYKFRLVLYVMFKALLGEYMYSQK